NTEPGPGRTSATRALNRAVVRPPWTISPPARVAAANSVSRCSGLRSPLIGAKPSTSSAVIVRVQVARVPIAGGCQSTTTSDSLEPFHRQGEDRPPHDLPPDGGR